MTRDEFLVNLQNGRQQWRKTWKGIDLFGTSRPRTPGDMSLRDILYHIYWYEHEVVEMIEQRRFGGSPWWALPADERNVHIKTEGEKCSLLQAWGLEQDTYAELVAKIQTLRDEELEEARFFQDMPSDLTPWEVIAGNTYEHYPDHLAGIF